MMTQKIPKLILVMMVYFISSCNLSNPSVVQNRVEERILNFPSDHSLGKLYILEESPHFLSGEGEVKKGEARGNVRVTIPKGWLLELRLSPEASIDLSFLATLNHNDLQAISFSKTQVTDKELVHLKQLSGLKILDLSNTQITGTGLTHLKELSNLQSLNLSKTKISDTGLAYIKEFSALENLNLYYTNVSDVGLKQLQGLTQLKFLNLGWTKITDTGVFYLKGLTQLRQLNLDSTKISDVGLEKLQGLKNLQKLSLNDTEVTEIGVKNLSRYLPPCSIDSNVIDGYKLFPSCYSQ